MKYFITFTVIYSVAVQNCASAQGLAEYKFLYDNFPGVVSNRMWVSGQEKPIGNWIYSTGPEKDAQMYTVAGDKTFGYINWCTGEPGVGGGEPAIEYFSEGTCFNNVGTDTRRIQYICEKNYNQYEPFLQPSPISGGLTTVLVNDQFPIGYEPSNLTITLSKVSGGPTFECANPTYLTNPNRITCIMPPGESSLYNVVFVDGEYNGASLYQYLPPYVATLYPKGFTQNSNLTITGNGFGNNPAKIQVSLPPNVACNKIQILKEGTAFQCTLTKDVTQGLFPVSISVNSFGAAYTKAPFFYNSDSSFYTCFYSKTSISQTVEYINSQKVEGMPGVLGIVSSSAQYNFLKSGCGYIIENAVVQPLGDLWMNAIFNETTNKYYTIHGPNYGKETSFWTSSPLTSYYNASGVQFSLRSGVASEIISPDITSGSAFTSFKAVSQQVNITQPTIILVSTTGQFVQLTVQNLGTTFSNIKMMLSDGNSYPNTYIDYDTQTIGFNIPPGINGPFDATINQYGLNNTGSSLTIDYFSPNILNTSPLATDGLGLVVSGTNFTDKIQNIKMEVQIGSDWFQCTSCQVLQDYYQIRCDAPVSFGSRNSRITIGLKQSINYILDYERPVITSMTPIGAAGGLVTVTGTNFYINDTIITLKVGPNQCTGVSMSVQHKQFTCVMAPGNITDVASISLDAATNNSAQTPYNFGYSAPVVTNATTVKYLKGGFVTITGSYFGNYYLSVKIHNQSCLNPVSDVVGEQIVCNFTGTVDGFNSPDGLFVNVTVNGLTGGANVFRYDFPECPNNCSNHGVCIKGQCKCDKGWELYNNCSSQGDTGGPPTPGTNGTGSLNGKGFNFTSAITHIREIDDKSVPLIETTLPMVVANWTLLETSNKTHQQLEGTFGNVSKSVISVNVTLYLQSTTIEFAGQTIDIPANTLKYVVAMRNWTFASPLNSLQIIFSATAPKSTEVGCSTQDSTATNGYNEFQVIAGDSVLQAKFANGLIVDNRVQVATVTPLDMSDPLMQAANKGNQSLFTQMTAVVSPAFEHRCVVDPSFRTLINTKDTQSCSGKDNRWRNITIIVVCVIGGCAIIVASVIGIRKSIANRKYRQEMKMKQIGSNSP
ncbi:IPT/TIG domain-containing protein [Heterostelium album PN500]|uniref:IPT/TIG domain-containing protein n=1 Tax=Heterostelium pallidum (strain ATCC 26659 / Pp 5 / PN500) TaxID=670386 RepID=D3BUE6_HETP5|nr:IPT/TIG domain-containing protein [Heterostelium album PN500]EFA74734.1 IPT/TIG domain-containing protein [Heterostelium album PN500]|eukprot:XP_020426868.1 IPT/TIG domain-containing protein [Heterostelium album PN500]